MKLDKKSLDDLLSLDDNGLKKAIEDVAKESGIDLSGFGISKNEIEAIRNALSGATDKDLENAEKQLNAYKKRNRS